LGKVGFRVALSKKLSLFNCKYCFNRYQQFQDRFKTGLLLIKNISFPSENGVLHLEEKFMAPATYTRLIRFLQEDLAISRASIDVAERVGGNEQRQRDRDPNSLPMVLWQYGLVTLEQLDKIFDWLAQAY